MNTKLHAVADADGRPLRYFMTAGQVSDFTGSAALLGGLPKAEWLLADRGYDADWFREALKGQCPGLAAAFDQDGQLPRHAAARDRCVGDRRHHR